MKKLVLSAMLSGLVGSSFAGIVYTDLNPDEIVGESTAVFDPQFNASESIYDDIGIQPNMLAIGWNDLDNGYFAYPSNNDVEIVGTDLGGGSWEVSGLTSGTAIGPGSSFNPDNSFIIVSASFFGASNFPTGTDAFIGFKLPVGSNTHYGWIRVNINGNDMTIKDWAYEDTPNTPINAGDGIPSGGVANDDCAGAVNIAVTSDVNNCDFFGGFATSEGATDSGVLSSCSTAPVADDDVWFSFTATSSSTGIEILTSNSYDGVIETFTGSCGSLTHVSCGDNLVESDQSEYDVFPTSIGTTYFVRVFDYYTYESTIDSDFGICIYNDVQVGIEGADFETVAIYPNPVTDNATIDLGDLELEQTSVELLDVSGRVVYASSNIQTSRLELPMSNLTAGIYLARVSNVDAGKTFKLIKE